jgi:hypothetical protein
MEGIRVTGNENAIASNVARSGGGSGFVVNGNGNVMTANEARNNAKDGFTIESGAGNQWLDSSSTSNGGEGFDNKGANTTVSNVTSNKNRIDCASDGSLGSATGLHCADGSDFGVASEIN